MVCAPADEFLEVALEMLAPIVVEAAFHFDFESVAELLSDDFHEGSGADVSSKLGGDGDVQSLGAATADDFFFNHDFLQRKVLGLFAA